jgi:hypothetical protein
MKLIPVGNGGPDISSYDHFSCGLGSDDLGRFIRVPFFLSHCVRIIACARIRSSSPGLKSRRQKARPSAGLHRTHGARALEFTMNES